MKVKTSELTGPALDWAVTTCEAEPNGMGGYVDKFIVQPFSTDWAHGGPIIDREKIDVIHHNHGQTTKLVTGILWFPNGEVTAIKISGETPLIAAMRCYVTSKLGNEVEIPEELGVEE